MAFEKRKKEPSKYSIRIKQEAPVMVSFFSEGATKREGLRDEE